MQGVSNIIPPTNHERALTRWLAGLPSWAFAAYAAVASFAAYFAMYAFRKPFTAGEYEGTFLGSAIALKTSFVLAQVLGYMCSKYLGVKVCSEAGGQRRGLLLVTFIVIAELALVLFGVLPGEWRVLALFLNGLPLGMVWGLVVSYLEGRRCSDLVLAGLCGSFIVSSGVVKDVARWLMEKGVTENWMPAVSGLIFLPLFVIAVVALAHMPPQSAKDIAQRVYRKPMTKADRRAFFLKFAPGLIFLFVLYFMLTAYRDFRDNYGVEIFQGLGHNDCETGLFTRTEVPVAIGALLGLAAISVFKDNRKALMATMSLMILGMAVLFGATLLHSHGIISGLAWMVATGLGAYLAYVPFNAVLFERIMAATGSVGTAVFGIQLADAIGYTGSVIIQLYKDLGQHSISRLAFFEGFTWILSISGLFLLGGATWYFLDRARRLQVVIPAAESPVANTSLA